MSRVEGGFDDPDPLIWLPTGPFSAYQRRFRTPRGEAAYTHA
jgi:hypothetical protein